MLSCPAENKDYLFWAATAAANDYGFWDGWSTVRSYSLVIYNLQFQPPISPNQWIFISFFADQTSNQQFGFRYYLLPSTTSAQITYNSRTVSGTYQLIPSAKIFWGGKDNYYGNCYCYQQYVRLYWDYLADTEDKMINLALMSPDSILMMLLYFALIILLNRSSLYLQLCIRPSN